MVAMQVRLSFARLRIDAITSYEIELSRPVVGSTKKKSKMYTTQIGHNYINNWNNKNHDIIEFNMHVQ